MTKTLKYHLIFILFLGITTTVNAQSEEYFCLNRNASFLFEPYPKVVDEPLRIDLKRWKIKAGDTLKLEVEATKSAPIVGIFSKDSLLNSHHHFHRIPSAIDYGEEIFTSKSLFSKELTDVIEDFVIENQSIIVPKEADYLFVGKSEFGFDPSMDSICFLLSISKKAWRFDVKTIAKVKVAKRKAKILLWDDSNEDGDVVSIYLNGKKIVDHYEVINKRHKIILALQSGRNEFLIYAENTGRLGDNTAVLQVEGKPYRRIIHVNSKARTAKRIVLICEE